MTLLNNPLLILLPLLLIATWIDLLKHRIPNWLTLSGVLLGVGGQSLLAGWSGVADSLAGLVVGLVMLLPFYLARGMGAGDVKLMAAVGCFLNAQLTVYAVAATLISGGVLAVCVLLAKGGVSRLFKRYLQMFKTFVYARQWVAIAPAEDEPARIRFPYAAAIATGTIFVLWQQHKLDSTLWQTALSGLLN
jgi:prepilin peptidase CpaA